jgi:hypothetical protein
VRTLVHNEEALKILRGLQYRMEGCARYLLHGASRELIRRWCDELKKLETELDKENQ